MKRLLIFLLLFCSALLIVLWIERRPPRGGVPEGVPSPPPVEPRLPPEGQGPVGISPGSRFELRGFSQAGEGEEPMSFEVRAEDSALEADGTWSLEQVVSELFDPEDGARQVELRAARGKARIQDSAVPFEPKLQSLELTEVTARVERGSPVLPLTVTAPRVEMPIESRLLVAPDEAVISGPSLEARGRDALLDLPQAQFEFRGGGTVSVQRPGGESAELDSAGPLRLYRQAPAAAAGAPLFLAATGGAEVRLSGASATEMNAREILIRADESGPGEGFVVRSLEMQDDVVLQAQGMRAAAQRSLVELDPTGAPSAARFEGLPSAELSLLSAEELSSGTAAFGPEDVLRLAGEGPMELRKADERFEVQLQGPATVAAPGADLRAGGALFGWRDASGNSGFRASGGVVLEQERSTLETAELEASFLVSESPDAPVLHVETRGGARLVGTFGPGQSFTLATPDRLVAERRGLVWHVVEATNVVLNVEHPDGPFEARARHVSDLDLEQASLSAEGDVSFRGPKESGRGERMRLDADRTMTLEGTDERPARFEGAPGWVEARELVAREGRLEARGAVQSELAAPEGESRPGARFALSSDALDVEWELGDETLVRLDLRATGNVETHGQDVGRDSLIRSQRFSIQRPAPDHPDRPESVRLLAEDQVRATLRDARGTLVLESARLEILRDGDEQNMSAEGDVRFSGHLGVEVEGNAERFDLDGAGNGRLTPAEGQRLFVRGNLTKNAVPFELSADELQMEEGALVALAPDVLFTLGAGSDAPVEIRARARRLHGDAQSVTLEEGVSIQGETSKGVPWSLEADRVRFEGDLDAESGGTLRALKAEGNVRFGLAGTATAYGDTLEGSPLGQLKLRGKPAAVDSALFRLESEWIDFDPALQIVVGAGQGTLRPSASEQEGAASSWKLEYFGARTLIEPDSLVLVLQEPQLVYPSEDGRLRATWAVLWLDRHRWERMPAEMRGEETPLPQRDLRTGQGLGSDLFGQLQASGITRFMNEAYFEGPIELTQGQDLLLNAGAIYLDAVTGQGWISDATVNAIGRLIGLDFDKLIVKTQWLRLGADGSLRAQGATVTPCDFVVPHLRIVTGDLRITPVADKKEYELSMRDNRIELFGLPRIPLPPIRIGTNEQYEPLWRTLRLANSARFGTLVSAGIKRPAEGIGKVVNKAFHGNPFDYDASYQADASWLGSRGVLLDLGMEAQSKGSYWLEMGLGGLPDRGEDKGFIRVDEDERDLLRLWYRADGRWVLSEKDNLDISVTAQSDAGVQSEFFESDFLRYERDETYVRWTRASNGNFAEASVVPHLEGFRSQVAELPSASLYGGTRPLVTLGDVDVLYTGRASAGWFQREAGDPGVQSPFSNAPPIADPSPVAQPQPDGAFEDGLGNRDVLRFDTEQRLEAPMELGESAVRATPFLDLQWTAWDEGVDPDAQPQRLRTEAGLRLATTFWKRTRAGLHQIVPFLQPRAELALEEDGGDPVPLDATEAPIDGSFVDIGLRGRFGVVDDRSILDVEVVNSYGEGLADESQDGWQPTEVFARCEVEPFGHPFEIWHDGRHDLDDSQTVYSLLGVATRWSEDLRLEAAHHRGLDANRDALFEAATVRAIWRWTEKWEFEGRQTFSLLENDRLDSDLVVRRYGHDVVVEFEASFRAGEGASISVNIRPRFGFRPSRVGYLNY